MTPLGPRGPRGSATDISGYYSDYPFERKVAGKPNDSWSGQRSRGSSRTPGTPFDDSARTLSGPYSWPPDYEKEPDPENTEKTLLFYPVLNSFFSHPLPLAPLFTENGKKRVSKSVPLFRLLRLVLGTSKTVWRVTFRDENWPILWHIPCFPQCGNTRKRVTKAIRKLQRIIRGGP